MYNQDQHNRETKYGDTFFDNVKVDTFAHFYFLKSLKKTFEGKKLSTISWIASANIYN